jgi:signal peptidase II
MKQFPYKFLIITIIIILLDQVSKYFIMKHLYYESIPVIGEFFRLTHVQNPGAAFSFDPGSTLKAAFTIINDPDAFNKLFFSIISGILVLVIFFMLYKARSRWEKVAYAMIIGGAFGNTIDRIRLGSVTDFLDFMFFKFIMERWPIFNIADSSIVVAVAILGIYIIFFDKDEIKE